MKKLKIQTPDHELTATDINDDEEMTLIVRDGFGSGHIKLNHLSATFLIEHLKDVFGTEE